MMLKRAAVAAFLLLSVVATQPADAKSHKPKHHKKPTTFYVLPNPVKHYMGGCTRTTQYLWTGYRTASGSWPAWGEVAADPSIPFGALVYVPGLSVFRVQDRGGAVYGNHIDIFVWALQAGIADCYTGVYWTMPFYG